MAAKKRPASRYRVKTLRINRIGEKEFDFTCPQTKEDAHLSFDTKVKAWHLDVFKGTRHVESNIVGENSAAPDWNEVMENLL